MKKGYETFLAFLLKLTADKKSFQLAGSEIDTYVKALGREEFIQIVKEIGTIPEIIVASSTEEKLYSKASDIVLARCFNEIGLKAKAVSERGNSADIIAESEHGYTLVADAKTFRLSRTAKNQKDFKIATLSKWRGMENDFAVLVAPYFQYPNTSSQIYSSSLSDKVCLLSWEHMLFLLNQKVSESISLSLEQIWNAPTRIERDSKIAYADRMNCLFPYVDKMVCDRISISQIEFKKQLDSCKSYIIDRSDDEILILKAEINNIKLYTKEQAIRELVKSRKLNEKISAILSYKKSL
jgi:HindIII restriction endonuclease.